MGDILKPQLKYTWPSSQHEWHEFVKGFMEDCPTTIITIINILYDNEQTLAGSICKPQQSAAINLVLLVAQTIEYQGFVGTHKMPWKNEYMQEDIRR